jgi:hypothetical protein
MRRADVVKANLLASFDVDPAIIRKTATRKSDKMGPSGVDDREFQIAGRAVRSEFASIP